MHEFGEQVFVDEACVHILVDANGTVLATVHTAHLIVEGRRRTRRKPTARGVHNQAGVGRVTERAELHIGVKLGVVFQQLLDQVLPNRSLRTHLLDQLGIADTHRAVRAARHLPQFEPQLHDDIGRMYVD